MLLLLLVVMVMMIVMTVVGDDDDEPRREHRYPPVGSASPRYRCVWRSGEGWESLAPRARGARARMCVLTLAHVGDQVLVLETIPIGLLPDRFQRSSRQARRSRNCSATVVIRSMGLSARRSSL
jgi:hypothetical protein